MASFHAKPVSFLLGSIKKDGIFLGVLMTVIFYLLIESKTKQYNYVATHAQYCPEILQRCCTICLCCPMGFFILKYSLIGQEFLHQNN